MTCCQRERIGRTDGSIETCSGQQRAAGIEGSLPFVAKDRVGSGTRLNCIGIHSADHDVRAVSQVDIIGTANIAVDGGYSTDFVIRKSNRCFIPYSPVGTGGPDHGVTGCPTDHYSKGAVIGDCISGTHPGIDRCNAGNRKVGSIKNDGCRVTEQHDGVGRDVLRTAGKRITAPASLNDNDTIKLGRGVDVDAVCVLTSLNVDERRGQCS